MPEALSAVLADPGLPFVGLISLIAGLVYGFAGFGSALIFMPLATLFVTPPVAVAAFSMSALASFVTVIPGAWKAADRPRVLTMVATCVLFTPLGVLALRFAPTDAIRLAIGVLTLLTLATLLAGWRVPVGAGIRARLGIGALAGITGGSTGLNGPPVILFNLATEGQPVAMTRGNLAVFLTLSSLTFLPQLWLQGLLPAEAVWLGVLLLVPYAIGTGIGTALFRPEWAWFYRRFAYALIGVAGLAALPIWG